MKRIFRHRPLQQLRQRMQRRTRRRILRFCVPLDAAIHGQRSPTRARDYAVTKRPGIRLQPGLPGGPRRAWRSCVTGRPAPYRRRCPIGCRLAPNQASSCPLRAVWGARPVSACRWRCARGCQRVGPPQPASVARHGIGPRLSPALVCSSAPGAMPQQGCLALHPRARRGNASAAGPASASAAWPPSWTALQQGAVTAHRGSSGSTCAPL
mmetsp:Transcript_3826/g.13622  ORF Transcript_3826/g.13622 Transcript_3826/m.13622 type:complete len:210 (+) Transcript_3826:151-780(+)